jgi:hypothetical protein
MDDATVGSATRRRRLEGMLRATAWSNDTSTEYDFSTPIDRERWFVCPTLTPLYYASVYHDLDEPQRRRYNQLTALCFSELIGFFETTFASCILAALARSDRHNLECEFIACLEGFVAEEREHTRWWHRLNRLSEPELYTQRERVIVRLPASARFFLRQLTQRPDWFPMVYWVMLALEERSLEISRRCMRMPADQIEPRYLAIYSAHLKHELRHVQLDLQLIDRFYRVLSPQLRQLNARLLRFAIGHFLLPPTRSAVRVIRRLTLEYPVLLPLRDEIEAQLAKLGSDEAYQSMMYSRRSTPITFSQFDRYPEMHAMRNVLYSYEPQ